MTNWLLVLILIGLVGGASALMTVVETAILAVKVFWWLVVACVGFWAFTVLVGNSITLGLLVFGVGGCVGLVALVNATAKPLTKEQQAALAYYEWEGRGFRQEH